METPLHSVAQLRHATTNLQQLVGELAASPWEKATDQECHFPDRPATIEELDLVVAVADWPSTHYTLVCINNLKDILDVEGYVRKETIADTGAAKVRLSKTFAAAINCSTHSLSRGVIWYTIVCSKR